MSSRRFLRELISRGLGYHLLLLLASALVPLALFGVIAWQDRLSVVRNAQAEVEHNADSGREHALNVFHNGGLLITLIDRRIQSMSWDEIAASREVHDYLVVEPQQVVPGQAESADGWF